MKWINSDNGKGPILTDEQRKVGGATCLDVCDAFAFCKWAGKHLCGYPASVEFLDDEKNVEPFLTSEWFYACTNGGQVKESGTGTSIYDQVPDAIPGLYNMSWGVGELVDPKYPPGKELPYAPFRLHGGQPMKSGLRKCATFGGGWGALARSTDEGGGSLLQVVLDRDRMVGRRWGTMTQ